MSKVIPLGKSGTITAGISVGATQVSLSPLPATQSGYLVLDNDNSSKIEEVSFSHSGSNPVTISAAVNAHSANAKWLIGNTNGYYQEKQDILPSWTNWTPTVTGFSGTPTVGTGKYIRIGNVGIVLFPDVSGTSNATTLTCTNWPLTPVSTQNVLCNVKDNNAFQTAPGQLAIVAGQTTLSFYKDTGSSGAWTNTNAKQIQPFIAVFEVA